MARLGAPSHTVAMSREPLQFIVLGESGVGKTSFADKVALDTQYHRYDPFAMPHGSQLPDPNHESQANSTRMKLQVDGELLDIGIMDVSLTPIRVREPGFVSSLFDLFLRDTDGVLLLYDITSEESYKHVTEFGWDYIWACRSSLPSKRFGCTLVGNKVDLVRGGDSTKRQVPKDRAEEWASMVGVNAFEVDRFDKSVLEDVLRDLVKHTDWAQRRTREDMEVIAESKKGAMEAQEPTAQPTQKTKHKSKVFSTVSRFKNLLSSRGFGASSKA
ncbi:uncharacterized protein CC84DRAFT_1164825 [Paraphaeosphaeria sporulosa]|uniref:P-loop containing nucleoside triphosphate hydrolase protein n=1 Tax=Paraphaeosphaeria sporulosa TaxID=1460663 RepID=A0A177CC75_9PLEO|nr:uncharacterized protein CC84DRAFT_1164825 [Paraphaeosphaeria sporulosa]OAG04320.1 hypothetical protein CC84DRAFT_1164825 [Paraphaeosphaeria sporulosa]